MMNQRTGGRVLIQALKNNGVTTIFGVPGESYLEALDALYDERDTMRYITCRHEGGASFMAEAHAKTTSRPGICFVTRGPGASNATIGIHTAYQNSTPLIMLIGQVPRGHTERESFQEIDYRRMFGEMTKWVSQIDDAARIPEYINRAFQVAMSGRPGPVVLALPEDMLRDYTEVTDMKPATLVQAKPGVADIESISTYLETAKKPLFILGGGMWTDEARLAFEDFAKTNNLPVCVAFRRQDLFNNRHDNYVGDLAWGAIPSLIKAVEEADLIVALGARLDEGTTFKYSYLSAPDIKKPLIHIYPDGQELGRVYQADLMINAGVCETAFALQAMAPLKSAPKWTNWLKQSRDGYIDSLDPGPQTGDLDMGKVMAYLRDNLAHDAIVTAGAGNYADWPNKIYQYGGIGTNLSPISGAMGYSVPAAAMASVLYPEREVVAFSGDGEFLMNGQELGVAMQYGGTPIILVINNNLYGTIRMHQQRRHPGRISGTELVNPDFATYGKAFGAHSETITKTEEFAPAFERARASGKIAVLELKIDPECICINTPNLSKIE